MNRKYRIIIATILVVSVALFVILNTNKSKETQKKYDCEFIRTYRVYGIYESNDDKYLYATIREFQAEDIQTVKISKVISDELKVGENYEFKYKQESKIPRDDILSIYNNSKLLSVKSTDLVGLEQNQENYCK